MSTLNVSKGGGGGGYSTSSSTNVGTSLKQKEREKSKEKDFKKDESLLDKLGTIGRSKKKQPENEEEEVGKVEYEGREAIDSSGEPASLAFRQFFGRPQI